jgi:hypothetical protein
MKRREYQSGFAKQYVAEESRLIRDAAPEKCQRLRRGRMRLVQELTKLQRTAEQSEAEEFFRGESEWPEY